MEEFDKEFDFEKVPIVEIANEILLDGVKRGASDIHFDPYKNGLAIRMRVDGVLADYSFVPEGFKRNMISRIKMIASMNIMETRLPQDGAIKTKIADKTLDLRVSSLPTHNGEKVVLRILDYSKSLQGLESLGFSEHNLKKIIKMIEIPNGIVLVTGATGSGKSTTVYSILAKLNTREVNIITVEDPVEMEVQGLNQVQANHEIGLDFATVLRSILRQDPDIIMIGEIRDGETARIAVRASITGHKVLSTIHTNNALNTIERLVDMDVERYLIGTSLNGVISQKLARKLCPHCRIKRETNDYEKGLFQRVLHKEINEVYDVNHDGCEHCFKGYKGRICVAEVLVITDEVRNAITNSEPKNVMRKLVYFDGHTHTLLEDGLEKIELGETNFDELFKLVDLENDLAVHDSFNEELSEEEIKRHNQEEKEIDSKENEETLALEKELTDNNNQNNAETQDTSNEQEVKIQETPSENEALDTQSEQEVNQEIDSKNDELINQEAELTDNNNQNNIETLDTLDKQETVDDGIESIELLEDLDDTTNTSETSNKPIETIETLDTDKNENVDFEMIDLNLPNNNNNNDDDDSSDDLETIEL